jgi:hypothetical protein
MCINIPVLVKDLGEIGRHQLPDLFKNVLEEAQEAESVSLPDELTQRVVEFLNVSITALLGVVVRDRPSPSGSALPETTGRKRDLERYKALADKDEAEVLANFEGIDSLLGCTSPDVVPGHPEMPFDFSDDGCLDLALEVEDLTDYARVDQAAFEFSFEE